MAITAKVTTSAITKSVGGQTGQQAKQASAPSSPIEGSFWYDTDDDKLYIRDEDSWNELVSSISGTVDGGSY